MNRQRLPDDDLAGVRERKPDDTITAITADCGFTNKTHLKNLFRRCTGLSMCDYRKSVRTE